MVREVRGAGFALLAIMAAALCLRLVLTLGHPNLLGIDGGAYLLGVRQVLGDDVYHLQDFSRPPLGPGWLLVPFVEIWGMDVGFKVWQAIFSTFTIPAAYILSRNWLSRTASLAVAGIIALDVLHAEMLVTGALPLIGFALIALGVWAISNATFPDIARFRILWVIVGVVALIPFINMTSAGLAALIFPVYAVSVALFHPTSKKPFRERIGLLPVTLWPIVLAGVIGGLLALTALPWYQDVLFGSGNLRHPGPYIYIAPLSNWGWSMTGFGLLLGVPTMIWGRDHRLRALGVVIVLLGLLSPVWSYDEALINITFRGRYLMMMFVWPVAVWWALRAWEYVNRPKEVSYGYAD